MAKIIDDEFMVCSDCLMVIANGDYSGLAMNPSTEDQRAKEIRDGLDSVQGHVVCGDSDKDNQFSTSDCDCCKTGLAGSRHHCVVLMPKFLLTKSVVECNAYDFEVEAFTLQDALQKASEYSNNPPPNCYDVRYAEGDTSLTAIDQFSIKPSHSYKDLPSE